MMEPGRPRHALTWPALEPALGPVPARPESRPAEAGRDSGPTSRRRDIDQALGREAAEWGLLAGGVAHDLNNLLCGMMGLIDLALLESEGSPSLQGYLEEMRLVAEQAADLTGQMLAHSRRIKRPPEPIDLNRLVLDTSRLIGTRTGLGGALRCDLAPTLPLILGNKVQMVQVVLNLVLNAVEATAAEEGSVVIHTGTAEDYTHNGLGPTVVYLEVRDQGCGIPEEVLDRIFDPFFTTKAGSSGLGLSTVARIVQEHEGRVEVISRPGKGTTFRVLLPVA